MATVRKTEQQELEDVLEATLKENLKLKEEREGDKRQIAHLSRRVNPLSILAMLVLGNAQLAWEDDAALRGQIVDYFKKNIRVTSDTVMAAALEGILKHLEEQGVAPAEADVSAEELLAGGKAK